MVPDAERLWGCGGLTDHGVRGDGVAVLAGAAARAVARPARIPSPRPQRPPAAATTARLVVRPHLVDVGLKVLVPAGTRTTHPPGELDYRGCWRLRAVDGLQFDRTAEADGNGTVAFSIPVAVGAAHVYEVLPATCAEPQPTAVQSAYMEREVGGLITWSIDGVDGGSGVRACSGCAWGLDAVVPPSAFAPTEPGMAAKWVAAARAFGAKSLTLSAIHCSGFAMWPTNATVPGWGSP